RFPSCRATTLRPDINPITSGMGRPVRRGRGVSGTMSVRFLWCSLRDLGNVSRSGIGTVTIPRGDRPGLLGRTVLFGQSISLGFALHAPDTGGVIHGHVGYSVGISVTTCAFLFFISFLPRRVSA